MSERGQSLLETIVAVAASAVVVAGVLGAGITAIHQFGADAVQSALESRVEREMRLAIDILKYQGSSIEPTSVATTIPIASASPLPAQFSIATDPLANGGVTITITGSTQAPPRSAGLTTTILQRAPVPGGQIVAPGTIPAPTGAP